MAFADCSSGLDWKCWHDFVGAAKEQAIRTKAGIVLEQYISCASRLLIAMRLYMKLYILSVFTAAWLLKGLALLRFP